MNCHPVLVERQQDRLGLDAGDAQAQQVRESRVGNIGAEPLDTGDARIVMDDLGIGAMTDRKYSTMSTGEQRRCLLARALVHGPSVLVLDEPTSGLDLTATFHYLDLVRGYMRKGKTILLVTHHIHEIPPEIRRVVLLKKGSILEDGEKNAVLSESNLSRLFDCPVTLAYANGWYQALPGR